MRMLVRVALGAAAALATLAVPGEAVLSTSCDFEMVDSAGQSGVIKAGPIQEPGATEVTIVCDYRLGAPAGPSLGAVTWTTPGPVGMFAYPAHWQNLRPGDTLWSCTATLSKPGNIRRDYGCRLDFVV